VTPAPLLRRDLIVTDLEATSLAGVLPVLAHQLGQAGVVANVEAICDGLSVYAARAAVRVSADVALPHYRTDAVDAVVVCLGISRSPLVTDDPEWTPGPRIVALVFAPTAATTTYLQTVSALARALKVEGVIERLLQAQSPDDVLAIDGLAGLEVKPRLVVRDVMAPVVETAIPDLSVRSAVERMIRAGTTSLVVVGEKGEVLGLVNEADIMRGLGLDRTHPASDSLLPPLKVRDVMTRSVMCTADRANLDEVANIMINKDVEEVPVVAEGQLSGIVRRGDILRTLYGR
jgi:CBS domain-containing protein/mannitol/fructose-specific phosphotransferase system IIA component (Ntr-type)